MKYYITDEDVALYEKMFVVFWSSKCNMTESEDNVQHHNRNKKTLTNEYIKETLGSWIQIITDCDKKIFSHKTNAIYYFINHNLILYLLFGTFWIFRHTSLYGWVRSIGIMETLIWLGIPVLISCLFVKLFYCRNVFATIFCVFASFGTLLLLVDAGAAEIIFFSLSGAFLYSLIQILVLFIKKRGRRLKNVPRIFKRISVRYVWMVCSLFLVLAALIEIKDIFQSAVKLYNEKQYINEVSECEEPYILKNNIFVLEKFTDACWTSMNRAGREKACLQLAELELLYMIGKTDKKLTFYICNDFSESRGGFYDDDLKRIVADEQYQMDRKYMIDLVCHEAFHYYEHRLLDGADDIHNLSSPEQVKKYKEEFVHYIDSEEDYDGYYKQCCEADARAYAEQRAAVYLDYIDRNLEHIQY